MQPRAGCGLPGRVRCFARPFSCERGARSATRTVVGARAGGGMGAQARLLGVVALSCVAALTIVLQGWSGLGGGTRHVALEHWLPDGFGSLPEPAARPPEPPRQLSPPPPPPSHDLSPLPSRSASRLPSRSAHSTQPNPSHAPPSAAAVSLPNGGALASGRADCRPLQLLHWNILDGGGSRLHGIGDVVRTGGYDLVSLNELNGINLCRDTLYWPGLAEARGSLRHAVVLKAASEEPAGRRLNLVSDIGGPALRRGERGAGAGGAGGGRGGGAAAAAWAGGGAGGGRGRGRGGRDARSGGEAPRVGAGRDARCGRRGAPDPTC